MEFISVFDVFKIGVGPSSSHTLGPWKAARRFLQSCSIHGYIIPTAHITVSLFGSLSLTGKGHATDLAVIMGLADHDPETVPTEKIHSIIDTIKAQQFLEIDHTKIRFNPENDIKFEKEFLPHHANGMIFTIEKPDGDVFSETYYSIGGGFITWEGEDFTEMMNAPTHPYPIQNSIELLQYCNLAGLKISEIVLQNELVDRSAADIQAKLLRIWEVMADSIYLGCHTEGILPGGLKVNRRSNAIIKKLCTAPATYNNAKEWITYIRTLQPDFHQIMKWTGTFGIAVNEVNAAFGRVVTAPTNGSAGVIPAVLMYYLCFVNKEAGNDEIVQYLLTCGEIGSIFKKGSTISAAMGGCQAEIGVSSAMAAAGLAELMGGTPEQCTIAAEVAMEHHLGMTCDPIGGLVQVPCIERNSMGAIKAINAVAIALDRDPADVKVPLDNVIATMWETAQDMNRKYKETSEGGLATAVNIIDC